MYRKVFESVDHLFGRIIPNHNVRAILYMTVLFALVLGTQYIRFSYGGEERTRETSDVMKIQPISNPY
jgi:hypothetical protein